MKIKFTCYNCRKTNNQEEILKKAILIEWNIHSINKQELDMNKTKKVICIYCQSPNIVTL